MSIVRPMLTALAITAISGSYALAQNNPPAPDARASESFETVNKEFLAARNAYITEMRAVYEEAKKNGKEKEYKIERRPPGLMSSPRFLAIAEKDPEGAGAIDALKMTLRTSDGFQTETPLETRGKAVKILQNYFVTKPSIKSCIRMLASYDDADSKALIADVLARNPDRNVHVAVYRQRIANCERLAHFAEAVKAPRRLEAIEKRQGKDFVKVQLARAENAKAELDGLEKTLREKYGDLLADLSVGARAPEINIQTVDGKEARLSALKGKVVVIDVWATWCGPCTAMIPHERQMVERLKDKPFALVSISADANREALNDFLAKNPMPWTQCWTGVESKFAEDWDIKHYPTIYVIDADGVIRDKDLEQRENTDAELDKAVNALLKEMEQYGGKRADR